MHSSCAIFYKNIPSVRGQLYLDVTNINNVRISLSRLSLSSHRLFLTRLVSRPRNDRNCTICYKLEDEYHLIIEYVIHTD